jgi:hypothetical protein
MIPIETISKTNAKVFLRVNMKLLDVVEMAVLKNSLGKDN